MSTLKIVVEPKNLVPPMVDAGPDVDLQLESGQSGSSTITAIANDPDGIIVSYLWQFVGQPPGQAFLSGSATDTVTVSGITVPGTYSLIITVTDDDGLTASDTVDIIVQQSNQNPTSVPGENFTIDISTINAQLDPSYDATLVAGSNPPTYKMSVLNPQAITDLWLSDGMNGMLFNVIVGIGGNSNHAGIITAAGIVGNVPNGILSVQFPDGFDPTSVIHDQSQGNQSSMTATYKRTHAQLDGAGSFDPDGIISSYQWTVASGSNAIILSAPTSALTKARQILNAGQYPFDLLVTDNDGLTDINTVVVNAVISALNAPTISSIGSLKDSSDVTIGSLVNGSTININGHNMPWSLTANISDLDNHNVTATLQIKNANNGAIITSETDTVAGGNGVATFSITDPIPISSSGSDYIFEILATDAAGLTALVARNITLIDSVVTGGGGGQATISTISNSSDNCSSVRVINVIVPAGETRTVEHSLTSNLASISPSPGTINSDTQYTMTVNGSNSGGTSVTDSATLRVKNGGTVEVSSTLTRPHSGNVC